ncbi:condensation domain-containing protein [Nonomuraea sp. NPDC050663]|uniref:condensation domain-containing protein n=1 Tax=Nonomuraea sp. NPDC050663 TaxID=3364370 RepID=UPI00378A40DA
MIEASLAQRGMWVTEQLTETGSAFHVPLVVRFGQDLDSAALLRACAALVRRHPVLAGALREDGDRLVLVPGGRASIESAEGELDESLIREPFDLDKGPLSRFTLFGRTLLFVAHHVVFDGLSKEILLRDLAACYAQELEVSRAAAFWAGRWNEPGETVVQGVPYTARHAGRALATEITLDPPAIAGLSRFEHLLAALHVLLRGYGNADVVTAIDLSTRTSDTHDTIGSFVTELPVASSPRPEQTFLEFATGLRATLREIYRHRAVPLAAAVPHLRPHAALTPVSVSYRRRTEPEPAFEGVTAEVDWTVFNHAVRGAVHLQCVDTASGLRVSLRHLPEVDGPRLAADLAALVAADPGRALGELVGFETRTASSSVLAEQAAPAAASELTEQVRQIWEEVLGISPVLDDDDIFDLGGHSLTITQIIARMDKRLGVKVELDDFFDNPTIAGVLTHAR